MTSTTDDPSSSWRSLIYVPAKVDNDGSTILEPASLQVIDQLLLPHTIQYIPITSVQDGYNVIHNMNIRGAPLIAIVAILSLSIDLQCNSTTVQQLQQIETMNCTNTENVEDSFLAIQSYVFGLLDYLGTSRPTAVNLFNMINDVKRIISSLQQVNNTTTTPRIRIVNAIVQYAQDMLYNDEQDCRNIGKYGAAEIVHKFASILSLNTDNNKPKSKLTVMTICNTGSLATANYGTALGVIRSLHYEYTDIIQQVVVLETRPYNQGSRLTAFECIQDQLPNPILLCDNMITAYINNYRDGNSNNDDNDTNKKHLVIVVGADRVVANGDTANKIGTYQLAVLASVYNIPFYVAAPCTTLDPNTTSGSNIQIEIRSAKEVIESSNAPKNINVWNPAFDVTPAKYITGIITEKGVIHPSSKDGTYDIPSFLSSISAASASDTSKAPSTDIENVVVQEDLSEYVEQTVDSLPLYIANNAPKEVMDILQASSYDELQAVEMGDGNLNLVFIVSNRNTSIDTKIIVKQALPYVRCVGESWPLTLDRAYYEYTALQIHKQACPEHVPNLYYFNKKHALIIMEYLAPPIQILRKGLISGIRYNTMAYDMGMYCAKTLFRTSGFALSTSALRERVEFWSTNRMMCALTEQVVFTEPYIVASNNRWTTPQLDDDKKSIESDVELKLAASIWKMKFVTNTEALIHADLHTGSVMCSTKDHETYMIDPEFAFYGPMSFDTGAFIANLFLSYVSQTAHRSTDNNDSNKDYDEWILQQIVTFWNTFTEQFITLWNDSKEYSGFMYDTIGNDDIGKKKCQEQFMKQLLYDTLGFAGMKMLRRIVGIAHVEDLESISDVAIKAQCEKRGLSIARYFIINCSASSTSNSENSFQSIQDVVDFARKTK